MKITFRILAVMLLMSSNIYAQNPVKNIPEFLFYRLDNRSFTKQNIQQGEKVFFVFFDSSCDHCQHAIHDIDQHWRLFSKVAIYLVTLDNRVTINSFLGRFGPGLTSKHNVTILQDRSNEFILKFNPRKYPSMLLFSAKGNLLVYEDDDKSISRIYNHL
jgi:thioredoxin-related protein